jgi:site-specific DNA recombinase
VRLPSDTRLTIGKRSAKSERLEEFIKTLQAQTEPVAEFDERLWGCMVDFITVYSKDDIRVTFKDGTEIRA